jgi:hypothetical protein
VIVLGTDGAGRDGGRVDRRGRWLVRVATAGLAVVLLGLTGAAAGHGRCRARPRPATAAASAS